jgi:hypothetical protein
VTIYTYNRLANVLLDDKRQAEALDAFDRNVQHAELITELQPGPKSLRRVAIAQAGRALALRALNDLPAASLATERRIALLTRLSDDRSNAEAADDLTGLARAYRDLFDLRRDARDLSGAREAHLGQVKAIQRRDPEGKDRAVQQEIMLAHRRMASVALDLDAIGEARAFNEQSHALAVELARDARDREAQKQLVTSHGRLSWVALLEGRWDAALAEATQGLALDPSQGWIRMNLAHGYLFSGRVTEARQIYERHRDDKLGEGRTFAAAVLEDFAEFRKKGIVPSSAVTALAEIEALLRSGG